jgi:Transposase DDE domain
MILPSQVRGDTSAGQAADLPVWHWPPEPSAELVLVPPSPPPPPDPFASALCSRLPLAELALRLLEAVSNDSFLQGVFERYRGRSYERVISFPTLVHLLADALVEHQASGRQSFQRAQQDGQLQASLSALYGKLGRVPLSLSQGLLLEGSCQLQELFPPAARTPLPASLASMNLIAFDGKKIKHVARRLQATRGQVGQLYGGKLVVGLWINTRLALAFSADPDGEVSDTPLLPAVVRQVRSRIGGIRLWIGDRLFCDLDQPGLLGQQGDHFILRFNKRVSFQADPQRPAQQGTDSQGRGYVQEWGWIGTAKDRRRRYVRRITLYRPGEEEVSVITDLLDEQQYPARDILEAYLLRWEIENCFQQITEVFSLRRLIGNTPEATVFQASFCLLLYNVVMVARGLVAQAEQMAAEEISTEQLFYDVQRQLIAWNEVLPAEETVLLLPPLTLEQTRQRLRELAQGLWSERWRKTTGAQKPPPQVSQQYPKGGHTSVFRLLQKAKASQEKKPLSNSS